MGNEAGTNTHNTSLGKQIVIWAGWHNLAGCVMSTLANEWVWCWTVAKDATAMSLPSRKNANDGSVFVKTMRAMRCLSCDSDSMGRTGAVVACCPWVMMWAHLIGAFKTRCSRILPYGLTVPLHRSSHTENFWHFPAVTLADIFRSPSYFRPPIISAH